MVPNPGNPLDLDRFSYVRNNPIKYMDPTGLGVNIPDYEPYNDWWFSWTDQ
jgi:hypothetical protein